MDDVFLYRVAAGSAGLPLGGGALRSSEEVIGFFESLSAVSIDS